jgi:hypothetical protein
MFLEQIGVYGWSETDENLILSSILTGDPILLIGKHGSAKTHIANIMSRAMGFRFLAYDASKSMFEDVLGYPNIEKLKAGCVEYIPSPITIWDKEMVLIDEINRAIPELQSKWLEIIRSRKIMGFDTNVKWVWGAMNPSEYSGTVYLDDALIGRFSLFLYPPDIHTMTEANRIKVSEHMNGDDAPSLTYWSKSSTIKDSKNTIPPDKIKSVGDDIRNTIIRSHAWFNKLKTEITTLSEFLARFSSLLLNESKSEIVIDGRRLGFIYRNILSNRAIELAKNELFGVPLVGFSESALGVIQASIPIGINDSSIAKNSSEHIMENCYNMLRSYFDKNADINIVNTIYELFTTDDLFRRVQILLETDVTDFAKYKGWMKIIDEKDDKMGLTVFAYTALQVEHHVPGTIPPELLVHISKSVVPGGLYTSDFLDLYDWEIEYLDELTNCVDETNNLTILVSIHHIANLRKYKDLNSKTISETHNKIKTDIERLSKIIENAKISKNLNQKTNE